MKKSANWNIEALSASIANTDRRFLETLSGQAKLNDVSKHSSFGATANQYRRDSNEIKKFSVVFLDAAK